MTMKVALIHDHLGQDGGAERVLLALQEMFPESPTYVLVHDRRRSHAAFLSKDIRTSFLQRMPFGIKHYQWYLPLMPSAVEQYDLSAYDVVISSTSSFAKGVITRPDTVHFCYCHTPTRFLWSDTHEYVRDLRFPNFIKKYIPLRLTKMRIWDFLSASRVDFFIANSKNVQRRIRKYYQRESKVMYPPVDFSKFYISKPKDYFLSGGRLVAYKNFEIAIMAARRLGIKLKIFGDGPHRKSLQKISDANIEFLGKVTDEDKAKLYSECIAFLNPQEEDLGITMIEAAASGRPVVAYKKGGALEIVQENINGFFFEHATVDDLTESLTKNKDRFTFFFPTRIRSSVEKFDKRFFRESMVAYVREQLMKRSQNLDR